MRQPQRARCGQGAVPRWVKEEIERDGDGLKDEEVKVEVERGLSRDSTVNRNEKQQS